MTYGAALGASQLDATANVAGTSVAGRFTYSPLSSTVLGAGNETLMVTFTPTDTKDYKSTSDQVTINVARATPTVTWANPATIAFGTPVQVDHSSVRCPACRVRSFTARPWAPCSVRAIRPCRSPSSPTTRPITPLSRPPRRSPLHRRCLPSSLASTGSIRTAGIHKKLKAFVFQFNRRSTG